MNTDLKSKSRTTFQCVLAILCLVLATSAQAVTLYWDNDTAGMTGNPPTAGGGAANGVWSNGANWWDGAAYQTWASTNVASFHPAGGSARVVTNTASITAEGLVFTNNWTLTNSVGSVLTLSNVTPNITFSGANASVIGARLDGAINIAGTTDAASIGVRFAGANTGVTNTTINLTAASNIIDVASTSAFGSAGAPVNLMAGKIYLDVNLGGTYNNWPTTLGAGTTFRARNANTTVGATVYPGNFTLAGNANISVRSAAGNSLTCSGSVDLASFTLLLTPADASSGLNLPNTISGTGSITLDANGFDSTTTGAGVVRLGGANTFSGSAIVTKGTLALTNVNALQNATLDTGAAGTTNAVTFVVPGASTYNLGALTGSDDLAIGGNTLSVGTKAGDTTFSAIISGSGGRLTKVGADKLTLGATNTYDGLTTVSSGTLALGASGLLAAGSSVSIASGTTFDVSALATYTHGASASLTASGTASTPAILKGGTTVDLGSRPVTVNFTPDSFSGDANSPALNISQGALTINGGITVANNGASALGAGTYVLISQASGTVTGTPTLSGTVGGLGLVGGNSAIITNTGTSIDLVVQGALPTTTTVVRAAGTGSTTTYGDTLSFNVSVSPALAAGTVELRDGGPSGTLLGSGTLVGGTNTITPADNALTAGSHANIVALYLGNVNYSSSVSTALSTQTVTNKPLTVSGSTADSKYFDTTTTATLSGGTLIGVESGDTVTLNQTGTFVSASPGTAIAVTSTSTLGGGAATNYILTQPTGLSADIYATAIWTGTTGDSFWTTSGNWLTNVVPGGANVIADFTALDITASTIARLNSPRTIGNLMFGDTDTNTPASWTLSNGGTAGNILTLAGTTPTVTVNTLGAADKVTINAVTTGTSGLTKAGPGTLALTGANTYSGGTVITNGMLTFNADAAMGVASSANNITLNGGVLAQAVGNLTLSSARSMTIGASGGTIANPLGGILTYNGIIGGTGLLTLDVTQGGGTGMTIGGQNTNTGGVTFTGSAASYVYMTASSSGDPGSLVSGPFGTGTVTFNGPGTRSTISADTTVGNAIIFAADALFPTVASEKSLTLTGPVTLSSNRTLTVNLGTTVPGKSLTFTNVISDGGNNYSLTKAGTGLLILSGANTYGGDTTVSAGTLELGQAYLAATSTVTVASSAILQLDFSVTNTVGSLILGGVTNVPGVYDSTTGAPYITGTGSLKVPVAGGPASTNADLISLVLSPAGTLSPTFASNVLTYAASEAFGNSPTVTVTNADLTATNQLIYNGATNALASGVPSGPLSLTLGVNNPVVVRVTAQDGLTVQTYTVNVTKQPSLTPVTLTNSVSGSTLSLSWPADHLGYSLQSQTNLRSVGLKTNWVTLPGSASVTTTNLPIDKANPTVFYRLSYP